jgi:hypothetical protein
MTQTTSQLRPALPRPGQTLDDRFELRAVLGEGGMACVFRAYDHHAAREVALKLLMPRYLGRPERERRFLREAELGRRARHRNLAKYLDAGRLRHADWPFVSMEIVEGRELGHQLARGALPAQLAARAARQIAGALGELHRAGVVHRDVTPMNVLICGDEAVLIDLSHAGDMSAPRVAAGQAGRLTQLHEVPGTHYYMSKEQALAAPVHPAMDVYGFGVTLVEMLTGCEPGGWDRPMFIEMQREGKFVPPRVDVRIHGDVPVELAELAHACTSAEPEDRPTFEEIVLRLDAVLERWPAAALEVVPGSSAGVEASAARRSEARGAAAAEEVPRRLGWPWVAAIVVVGIGMGAWAVWPRAQRAEDGAGRGAVVPSQAGKVLAPAKEASDPEPVVPEPITDVGLGKGPVEPEPPREPTSDRKVPRPRPFETEECARVREQATQAVAAYDWPHAVALARRSQCWRSDAQRKRILVQGLFHDNQWAECVRAGGASKDAEVKRWVEFCRRHAG